MCTNSELKQDIDDLSKDQGLMKTEIKYIMDDVRELKEMVREVIKQQKKLEKKMAHREQFFIDSVMEMKEMAVKMMEGGKNGEQDIGTTAGAVEAY